LKPADTVRSERVVTFVTPAEFEALQDLAERWASSLSATVHRIVFRALEAEPHTSDGTARRP
jgi:hypothetical protein